MNRTTMPDSGEIKLEGEYPDHLQDVWREGGFIYWAHTLQLLKTDLSGKILARADVDERPPARRPTSRLLICGTEVASPRLLTRQKYGVRIGKNTEYKLTKTRSALDVSPLFR